MWVVFLLGNQITMISGLPVPGNVFGMILLFILLLCGIVKLQYVQTAADFLLRHMLFFFIPIAVGLMNWGAVFFDYGLVLALALLLGTILPFFVVGIITETIYKRS